MIGRVQRAGRSGLCLSLLLILFGTWLLAGVPALASADVTEIAISPEVLQLAVDATGAVTVQVTDAVGLYTAQLAIQYDPMVVEVLEVQAGPLLAGGEPLSDIDNEGGSALFTITLIDPAPAINGSGVLMQMKLRAKSEGSSMLALEVMLSGADGDELPSRVKPGVVDVGDFPPATATSASAPPTATRPPASTSQPSGATPAATAAQPTPRSGAPTATVGRTTPVAGAPTMAASQPPAGATAVPPTAAAPTVEAAPPDTPAAEATETPPAGAPSIFGGISQGPLPTWLFVTLVGILVFLIGVVTVVVLVALFAWYRRATQD